MHKLVPISILVSGVVFIVLGLNATNSFNSDVSRIFTGSPTDKSIWMLTGGVIAAVTGLTMTLRKTRDT